MMYLRLKREGVPVPCLVIDRLERRGTWGVSIGKLGGIPLSDLNEYSFDGLRV